MLSVKSSPSSPYEQAWYAALTARMNVIYYQRTVAFYEVWDRRLRVTALVLSSAGVVAALKLCSANWAIAVGVLSAVISAVTLVWQFPERARVAAALLPQYEGHYLALRKLYLQGDGIDEKALTDALDAFEKTSVLEAEKVKDVNAGLLEEAQKLVFKEIGAT